MRQFQKLTHQHGHRYIQSDQLHHKCDAERVTMQQNGIHEAACRAANKATRRKPGSDSEHTARRRAIERQATIHQELQQYTASQKALQRHTASQEAMQQHMARQKAIKQHTARQSDAPAYGNSGVIYQQMESQKAVQQHTE